MYAHTHTHASIHTYTRTYTHTCVALTDSGRRGSLLDYGAQVQCPTASKVCLLTKATETDSLTEGEEGEKGVREHRPTDRPFFDRLDKSQIYKLNCQKLNFVQMSKSAFFLRFFIVFRSENMVKI